MAENLKLPWEVSLQEWCFHALAKICWSHYVLRNDSDHKELKGFTMMKKVLILLRNHIIYNKLPDIVPKGFSVAFSKQFKEKLINALFCMQRGYYEAAEWESKYQLAVPFTLFDPGVAGEHHASFFIDPRGHFNDLAWAKHFVADESQDVYCRLKIACLYCFEKTIYNIWNFLKVTKRLPCGGNIETIKSECDDMVVLWVYQLENKFTGPLNENNRFTDRFCNSGFRKAFYRGHEHAARFFWACFTTADKEEFLRELRLDQIGLIVEKEYAGFINFLYSLMPLEYKKSLVLHFQENSGMAVVWSRLLASQFFECALNDILSFSFIIPFEMYIYIFFSLTYLIKEIGYPNYKWIFKTLWNHISIETRKKLLKKKAVEIGVFVVTKDIELLEMIIQPLNYPEKDKMLLSNWHRAGISAMIEFSRVGEYDMMLRYLLLFFVSRDSITQNLTVRFDAFNFFNKIYAKLSKYFKQKRISETVKLEVNNVFDTIFESLCTIKIIVGEVESMNPTQTSK